MNFSMSSAYKPNIIKESFKLKSILSLCLRLVHHKSRHLEPQLFDKDQISLIRSLTL